MSPRVSVIVPVYERTAFLRAAVESVRAQTESSWELLLVDDGSSVSTLEYLDAIAAPPRIRVLRRAHSGIPAAVRNAGIRAATGTFVALLDSDDEWAPGKLAAQLAGLEESGCRWGYTAFVHMDAAGQPLTQSRYQSWRAARFAGVEGVARLDSMIALPSVIAERALIAEVGSFEESLRFYEDYDLWFRLALAAPPHELAEPLTRVRRHDEHYSDTNELRTRQDLDRVYARMIERLRDERVRRAVQHLRAVNAGRVAGVYATERDIRGALRSLMETSRHSRGEPAWWLGAVRALVRGALLPARRHPPARVRNS
jgi:glycosyltransferase involved in cell wall biosynthesis